MSEIEQQIVLALQGLGEAFEVAAHDGTRAKQTALAYDLSPRARRERSHVSSLITAITEIPTTTITPNEHRRAGR